MPEVLDMIWDGVQKIDTKLDTEVKGLKRSDRELYKRMNKQEMRCAGHHGDDVVPPAVPTTFNGREKTEFKAGPFSVSSTSLEATKYIAVLFCFVFGIIGLIYVVKMHTNHKNQMGQVMTKLVSIEKANGNGDPH